MTSKISAVTDYIMTIGFYLFLREDLSPSPCAAPVRFFATPLYSHSPLLLKHFLLVLIHFKFR